MGFRTVWKISTPNDLQESKVKVKFWWDFVKSNISKTVRDREMVSIEVKYVVMYGLSNGIKSFNPKWPPGVKGQGQTLKSLKSDISKTVRDREIVSVEVK